MNKFEIGEKVVCINDKKRWFGLGGLKKNEMYTITGFNPYDDGLILKEIKSPKSGFNAYAANRFRKVDYAFADRLLKSITPTATQPKVKATRKTKSYSFNFISLN